MQSNFDRSLSAVLKHEGGYVDNPKDPGGPTNRGITLASFRRYVQPGGTKADLKALTVEQASIVYRRQYWDAVLASELPSGLDYAVFDCAVHSGSARAVKALQQLAGVTADGAVGPQTLAAVAAAEIADLITRLCDQRLAFVQRLKTWPIFGKGWASRIAAVRKLALEMAAGQAVATPSAPIQPETQTPASDDARGWPVDWGKVALAAVALSTLGYLAIRFL